MSFFLHGVHVPHRKHTADKAVFRMECPKTVILPMSMHIGAPARPLVKVGDKVKIGTLIGEAVGAVSSPVYSSISGKVTKIFDMLLSNLPSLGILSFSDLQTVCSYNILSLNVHANSETLSFLRCISVHYRIRS